MNFLWSSGSLQFEEVRFETPELVTSLISTRTRVTNDPDGFDFGNTIYTISNVRNRVENVASVCCRFALAIRNTVWTWNVIERYPVFEIGRNATETTFRRATNVHRAVVHRFSDGSAHRSRGGDLGRQIATDVAPSDELYIKRVETCSARRRFAREMNNDISRGPVLLNRTRWINRTGVVVGFCFLSPDTAHGTISIPK